ncbi:subtilisin-like protease SBT1.8 [Tanacetum coccineum]
MEPWLCCLIMVAAAILIHPCMSTKQTYIVQMNHDHQEQDDHLSHLQSLVSSATHADLLYSYTTVYNGYAASLSPHHAQFLLDSPSVLGVYQDTLYHLHTTRTPHFLGILQDDTYFPKDQQQSPKVVAGSDVIIGVLDTGVWPELKSFDDSGMPPVPARWRGECEQHKDFDKVSCNNKLIGARKFYNGFRMAATKIGIIYLFTTLSCVCFGL